MENQKLIENSIYKTLNGEIESKLFTNQYQKEIKDIQFIKKTIVYRGVKISVDEETFLTEVNNQNGSYFFGYNQDGNWQRSRNWEVNIDDYGITITEGTPEFKDSIGVQVVDGKVALYEYIEHTNLYTNENDYFDFISFVSEKPVRLCINENVDDDDAFIDLYSTMKFEIDFFPTKLDIGLWHNNFTDIEVTLILAKKV